MSMLDAPPRGPRGGFTPTSTGRGARLRRIIRIGWVGAFLVAAPVIVAYNAQAKLGDWGTIWAPTLLVGSDLPAGADAPFWSDQPLLGWSGLLALLFAFGVAVVLWRIGEAAAAKAAAAKGRRGRR